jgi:hypothetical protein
MPTLDISAKPRRLAVSALALALASVLGGCSSGPSAPSADGPLAGASPGGFECGPVRPGGAFTFGIEDFQNAGHSPLELDSVALRDPQGLKLAGSAADPGTLLVGAISDWPPQFPPGFPSAFLASWRHHRAVPGFRLAPGKWFVMVIGVTAPRPPGGSTSGLVIRYHDSAGSYVVQDHFMYRVVTRPSC